MEAIKPILNAFKKSSKLFITVTIIVVVMSYGFAFLLGAVIF